MPSIHMIKITTGILAMLAVTYQPNIAQATNAMTPLPDWGQAGICGLLSFLLWWEMAKSRPAESKRRSEDLDRSLQVHEKCSEEISQDIKGMALEMRGMRTDADANQKEIAKLLTRPTA